MKHTMVFLTLFLLVTSAWAGTLEDDFDDEKFYGWRVTCCQMRLRADVSGGATIIDVKSTIPGMTANANWVAVDPYTLECEIRRVTNISKTILTLDSPLKSSHSKNDLVLLLRSPEWNPMLFGADAGGEKDSAAAFRAATADAPSGVTIRVPPGTYKLDTSEPAMFAGSSREFCFQLGARRLVGSGQDNCVLNVTASAWGVFFETRSLIENIKFRGTSTALGAIASRSSLGTIRNVDITEFSNSASDHTGVGIWCYDSYRQSYYDIWITGPGMNVGAIFEINTLTRWFGGAIRECSRAAVLADGDSAGTNRKYSMHENPWVTMLHGF